MGFFCCILTPPPNHAHNQSQHCRQLAMGTSIAKCLSGEGEGVILTTEPSPFGVVVFSATFQIWSEAFTKGAILR